MTNMISMNGLSEFTNISLWDSTFGQKEMKKGGYFYLQDFEDATTLQKREMFVQNSMNDFVNDVYNILQANSQQLFYISNSLLEKEFISEEELLEINIIRNIHLEKQQ